MSTRCLPKGNMRHLMSYLGTVIGVVVMERSEASVSYVDSSSSSFVRQCLSGFSRMGQYRKAGAGKCTSFLNFIRLDISHPLKRVK